MDAASVSVVIPVRNGERYLAKVLEAVFAQKTQGPFEVVVVDSGSTDGTLDIAGRFPVRLLRIAGSDFNHGITRNYAIARTTGSFVALLTADAVPVGNDWLEKLVRHLREDSSVAGVYSRQRPQPEASCLVQARVERFFTADTLRRVSSMDSPYYFQGLSPLEKHRFCNFDNVSSCIRKEVWQKIPFVKTDFGEDLEWSLAALREGYKIVYEPESVVYHSHDFSALEWYRRNRITFRLRARLFGKERMSAAGMLALFIGYTIRDLCSCCRRDTNPFSWLVYVFLVPLYSFCQALGQYAGTKSST